MLFIGVSQGSYITKVTSENSVILASYIYACHYPAKMQHNTRQNLLNIRRSSYSFKLISKLGLTVSIILIILFVYRHSKLDRKFLAKF